MAMAEGFSPTVVMISPHGEMRTRRGQRSKALQ
jgi:hypothetical protein